VNVRQLNQSVRAQVVRHNELLAKSTELQRNSLRLSRPKKNNNKTSERTKRQRRGHVVNDPTHERHGAREVDMEAETHNITAAQTRHPRGVATIPTLEMRSENWASARRMLW